jgi:hypothetical protein
MLFESGSFAPELKWFFLIPISQQNRAVSEINEINLISICFNRLFFSGLSFAVIYIREIIALQDHLEIHLHYNFATCSDCVNSFWRSCGY